MGGINSIETPHQLAIRLAWKQAVAKAPGTGIGVVRWLDIKIGNGTNGRPVLISHGEATRLLAEFGITQWDI